MPSSDVPPPQAPRWLVPLSSLTLGIGFLLWTVNYVLVTVRSIRTKSYGMPVLALALNISWEAVYGVVVADGDMWFERAGILVWMVSNAGLLYTTVVYAPVQWAGTNPSVGRHMGWVLSLLIAICAVGHYAFVAWWLRAPGMGHGDKTGKRWSGVEGYDVTEMAFWSGILPQLAVSAGSLAMLVVRGHSGGTGYWIW